MTTIAPSVTVPRELLLEAIAHIDAVGLIAAELNGGVETDLLTGHSGRLAAGHALRLYEPPDDDADYAPHRRGRQAETRGRRRAHKSGAGRARPTSRASPA